VDRIANNHPVRRPIWVRGCAVLAAALLLAVLASCGLFGTAVRRGVIEPPTLVSHLGPLHLVARKTLTPQCALEYPCGRPINILDPNLERYYVIWIVVSLPDGNGGTQLARYRFMAEPVGW
jgi:hypothetical protein